MPRDPPTTTEHRATASKSRHPHCGLRNACAIARTVLVRRPRPAFVCQQSQFGFRCDCPATEYHRCPIPSTCSMIASNALNPAAPRWASRASCSPRWIGKDDHAASRATARRRMTMVPAQSRAQVKTIRPHVPIVGTGPTPPVMSTINTPFSMSDRTILSSPKKG